MYAGLETSQNVARHYNRLPRDGHYNSKNLMRILRFYEKTLDSDIKSLNELCEDPYLRWSDVVSRTHSTVEVPFGELRSLLRDRKLNNEARKTIRKIESRMVAYKLLAEKIKVWAIEKEEEFKKIANLPPFVDPLEG